MKVKATQSVVASIHGNSVRLVIGREYDVSPGDADNLIRGKYAESAEPEDEPKAKKKKGASDEEK